MYYSKVRVDVTRYFKKQLSHDKFILKSYQGCFEALVSESGLKMLVFNTPPHRLTHS
jgi:hypothetical protein